MIITASMYHRSISITSPTSVAATEPTTLLRCIYFPPPSPYPWPCPPSCPPSRPPPRLCTLARQTNQFHLPLRQCHRVPPDTFTTFSTIETLSSLAAWQSGAWEPAKWEWWVPNQTKLCKEEQLKSNSIFYDPIWSWKIKCVLFQNSCFVWSR